MHKSNKTVFASTVLNNQFFTVNAKELSENEVLWTIGGSYFQKEIPFLRDKIDLEELSLSMGKSIEPNFNKLKPFIKANKTAGISLKDCPVHSLGHPFNSWLKNRIESAEIFYNQLHEEDIDFAKDILNCRRRILDSMGSFNFCGEETKIDWSVFSQKAGRLSIENGFNPMVLKKTERYKVQSRSDGRSIIYCDFKALEFRVALKTLGCTDYEDVEDPYSAIAEDIGLECQDRALYKSAMIAILYGSSLRHSKLNDKDKIKLINWFSENMNTNSLIEESMDDINSFGYIRSIFGRRIYEGDDVTKNMIINNKFQASGADFVFKSYSHLIDIINKNLIDAIPIFMIHDSIVFDVNSLAIEELQKITKINGYPIEWGLFSE